MTKVTTRIATTCEDIKNLLLEKNAKYGNSAVEPICARIDDKLSRIKNSGLNDATEDTLDDLIGYLILLKIARGEPNGAQVQVFGSGVDPAWQ